MNNYNNDEEPILNGINKFPLVTIFIIVITVIIIFLYRYLASHPKVLKIFFIIILSFGLIGFILKHFHINLKKAFFICLFLSISIIISVLILAQGDYIKIGKKNIISEESEQEEENIDNTVVGYANIECFDNNYENFKSLKGPCFNESTGFGYSYIDGSDCKEEEVIQTNNCSAYAKALKNKYESLLEEQLHKNKKIHSEDLLEKCKKKTQEEEQISSKCKPFNKNDKDSHCNNTSGGFKNVSTQNCPDGYGIVECDKNYSNGEYYSVNSTSCEPITSDFDYLCKQSNTKMNNYQSLGAKKYLPCSIDPITKKPIKYEAQCDYGYSKTKNLYYQYTPCYHISDDKSKFDDYCQKIYNVNATTEYEYSCPVNFKRAKCNLS